MRVRRRISSVMTVEESIPAVYKSHVGALSHRGYFLFQHQLKISNIFCGSRHPIFTAPFLDLGCG